MNGKQILLVIGGGIAAYKCLELIRRLRDRSIGVRVIMTKAAQQFITPLAVGALTNERVFTDLFDLNDEREIGHIRLSREADLIVVAPATANLMAKMSGGHADDLASAVLLATDKPILVAPAMNPRMWLNPATRRNTAQLAADGIHFVGPATGEMAESDEAGPGRLSEVPELIEAIEELLIKPPTDSPAELSLDSDLLAGRHVLITSGPTHEPIDPVRYIANRSSGRQGYAIAAAAAAAGAKVTLISGPTQLPDPPGTKAIRVENAQQMLAAVKSALPADVGVFAAAVADWRVDTTSTEKIKKKNGKGPPSLTLVENPDILKTISHLKRQRPKLVIGFAAETSNVVEHARAKLKRKGADWIIANDVSPGTGVMGGVRNTVHVLSGEGIESWPEMSKEDVATRIVAEIATSLRAAKAKR